MKRVLISVAIILVLWIVSVRAATAQDNRGSDEQNLLQLANRDRAAQRLAPLKWSSSLAKAARDHALRLARQNTLSHQLPGEPGLETRASQAGAQFSSIAENVAEGPSGIEIHQQWMNSPPHRANLLDPQLDSVGIAVVEGTEGNGTLFAVEDFSLAVGKLSLQEQEGMVNNQIRTLGLRILDYTTDARRSCTLDNGYAGTHKPSFVLHYATPDLQTLPEMLNQRIQTGKYHSALVGACTSNAKLGFSSYRIAVLLFE